MRSCVVCTILLASMPLALGRSLAASPRDDLLKGYPEAEAKYRKFYGQVQASGTYRVLRESDNYDARFSVKLYVDGMRSRADRVFFSGNNDERIPAELVAVATESRCFLIEKTSPYSPFVVKAFGSEPDDVNSGIKDLALFVEGATRIHDSRVGDILKDKNFAIGDVVYVDSRNGKLLKVSFRRISNDKKWAATGSFLLSPSQNWRVENYEIHYGDGQSLTGHADYSDKVVDGVPILNSFSLVGKMNNKHGVEMTLAFDNLTHGPTPEARFSLSEFGLQSLEQAAAPNRWNTPTVWMIGLGLTSLAAAFTMKRIAERRSRVEVH